MELKSWHLPYKRFLRKQGPDGRWPWDLVWLPIAKARAESWRTRKYEYILVSDLRPRMQ